jgi:hypothetical protein
MAIDATPLLGATQLAGVKVNPRGSAAKMAGLAGGHGASSQRKSPVESGGIQLPKFGRLAYLAATADEIVLLKVKMGLIRVRPNEVLVRVPRDQVAAVELGKGTVSVPPLTITFTTGDVWRLEVPTPSRKYAVELVRVIGPDIGTVQ